MISISVEAISVADLRAKLQELLVGVCGCGSKPTAASAPIVPDTESAPHATASTVAEGQQEEGPSPQPASAGHKNPRGRPRKEKSPEAPSESGAPAPSTAAEGDASGDSSEITLDSLKALLVKTMDAGGSSQCVKLMAGLGYAKVKDVQPEHFAEIEKGLKDILAEVTK